MCWPRVVLRLVISQAEKKPSKIGSWGKESEIEIIFMNNCSDITSRDINISKDIVLDIFVHS